MVGSPAATANTAIISFLLIPSAFSPENSILLSRDTPRSLPPRIQDAANPKGKGSGLALCACTYLHVHTQAPTHAHYTIYMHLGTHVHTRTNTRIQNGPERVRVLTSSVLNRFSLFRLKIECEKLASEKTEMQRHYVMVRHFVSSSSCLFIFVSSTVYSRQLKTSLRWHSDELERIRWIVALLSRVVTRFFGVQRFVWRKLRKLSKF